MRKRLLVLCLALCVVAPATAQVSIGIGLPNVSIGINLPVYPELVRVPGYPVYYAPGLNANFFFYDGLYWVFLEDEWYASSWYNGPWHRVGPQYVPVYILRVPVRYYRQPPPYFHRWQKNSPPRWGEHWGSEWSQHRSGWDRWNRRSAPAPAPLPRYQRNYSGDRYPDVDRQQALQQRNYRYQPRDPVVRQKFETQRGRPPAAAPQREMRGEPPGRRPEPRDAERGNPPPSVQHRAPATSREQHSPPQERRGDRGDGNAYREAPSRPSPHTPGPPAVEHRTQRPDQGAGRHQQSPPNSRREGAAPERERAQPGQERGQGRGKESGHDKRDKGDDRGQDQGR
jgi:hypothetical protein